MKESVFGRADLGLNVIFTHQETLAYAEKTIGETTDTQSLTTAKLKLVPILLIHIVISAIADELIYSIYRYHTHSFMVITFDIQCQERFL